MRLRVGSRGTARQLPLIVTCRSGAAWRDTYENRYRWTSEESLVPLLINWRPVRTRPDPALSLVRMPVAVLESLQYVGATYEPRPPQAATPASCGERLRCAPPSHRPPALSVTFQIRPQLAAAMVTRAWWTVATCYSYSTRYRCNIWISVITVWVGVQQGSAKGAKDVSLFGSCADQRAAPAPRTKGHTLAHTASGCC
eukprot:scaffold57955_cov69-Phaeocystis_antarctica.AAC.5